MDASERDAALRAEVRRYVQEHLDRLPVVVAARVGRITELFRPRQNIGFEVALHERERWVAEAQLWSYYVCAGLASPAP
jgi:hypothetical protein